MCIDRHSSLHGWRCATVAACIRVHNLAQPGSLLGVRVVLQGCARAGPTWLGRRAAARGRASGGSWRKGRWAATPQEQQLSWQRRRTSTGGWLDDRGGEMGVGQGVGVGVVGGWEGLSACACVIRVGGGGAGRAMRQRGCSEGANMQQLARRHCDYAGHPPWSTSCILRYGKPTDDTVAPCCQLAAGVSKQSWKAARASLALHLRRARTAGASRCLGSRASKRVCWRSAAACWNMRS